MFSCLSFPLFWSSGKFCNMHRGCSRDPKSQTPSQLIYIYIHTHVYMHARVCIYIKRNIKKTPDGNVSNSSKPDAGSSPLCKANESSHNLSPPASSSGLRSHAAQLTHPSRIPGCRIRPGELSRGWGRHFARGRGETGPASGSDWRRGASPRRSGEFLRRELRLKPPSQTQG